MGADSLTWTVEILLKAVAAFMLVIGVAVALNRAEDKKELLELRRFFSTNTQKCELGLEELRDMKRRYDRDEIMFCAGCGDLMMSKHPVWRYCCSRTCAGQHYD